jgi:hypothetical protein
MARRGDGLIEPDRERYSPLGEAGLDLARARLVNTRRIQLKDAIMVLNWQEGRWELVELRIREIHPARLDEVVRDAQENFLERSNGIASIRPAMEEHEHTLRRRRGMSL